MDPISLLMGGIALSGILTSAVGTIGAVETSQKIASAKQQIARLQQQENAQKFTQMTLNTQRAQMENLRNVQRAQATGLAAGVSQGAYSAGAAGGNSGVAGGQAQAAGQGNFNLLGSSQNYQIGKNIFGIDKNISQQQVNIAGWGGNLATDQGLMSLGGDLTKIAGPFSALLGQFGSTFGPQNSSAGQSQGMGGWH